MECFLACAEAGTIQKASQNLSIQQPAISKTLKRLETELGQKLMSRSNKGLELTDYGKVLFSSVKKAQQEWRLIYENASVELLEKSINLKVGCHTSIASSYFSVFFPKLLQQFPGLKIECIFSTSLQATQKLVKHEIDFGIVINPVRNADIICKNLGKEFLAIYSSQKNKIETIMYHPQTLMVSKVLKKHKSARLVEIPDYEVIANIIKNSNIAGILPNKIAERFQLTSVGDPLISVNLALIWNKFGFVSPVKRKILNTILSSFTN